MSVRFKNFGTAGLALALVTLLAPAASAQLRILTLPGTPPPTVGGLTADRSRAAEEKKCENKVFCGCGEQFKIYDLDENGNEIPGTESYHCDPNP